MKNYTMKIETILTEENSHLNVDFVEVVVDENAITNIVEAAQKVEAREFISIGMNFKWIYKGEETSENLQYEELYVYGDGDLIARSVGKYCQSDVESSFFRIKEVDAILEAKKKAKVTQIEVCINSLDSFAQDEKELLVQFADLVSQSDLESKIILYTNSLEMILDTLEDEDEYMDADFSEFQTRINDLIQADADQYIFD